MANPYENMSRLDIEGALASMSTLKERLDDMIREASKIDGVDAGEFSAYMLGAFNDTVGSSIQLAEEALPHATNYTGPTRADVLKDERAWV